MNKLSVTSSPSPASGACPVCGSATAEKTLVFPALPVFCNVLAETQEEALEAPVGSITLANCSHCGHVFNDTFDPELVAYSPRYENSLHHSKVFRDYATALIADLVGNYGLRQKRVLEIGCGQGDFLSELSQVGGNVGIGFDPSYAGDVLLPGVESIQRSYFTPGDAKVEFDAVVCRQVLEHIDQPGEFVATLREAIGDRDIFAFFEVPNGRWCFGGGGIWDIIYEHCGYFTAESLEELFTRNGFEVLEVREAYGGQFLTLFARAKNNDPWALAASPRLAWARMDFAAFADEIEAWAKELGVQPDSNGATVIWGTGSKGVTFLNLADVNRRVSYAVDINPAKQGMFVPGSGQLVVGPEFLVSQPPQSVIVMNPNYVSEIEDTLGSLGIRAEILVASGRAYSLTNAT